MNHGRINDMIAETIERIVKSGYENAYVMTVSINGIYDMDEEVPGDLRIMIPNSVSDAGYNLVVDLYKICSVEPGGRVYTTGDPFWRIRGKNSIWLMSNRDDEYFLDVGFVPVDRRETAVRFISSRFLKICQMPMSADALKFLDIELSVAGIFP